MIRYIKIEDENKRDAEITFKSVTEKNSVYLALENGIRPINKKVIKSSRDFTLESLIGKTEPTQEEYDNFSDKLKSYIFRSFSQRGNNTTALNAETKPW